MKNKLFLFSTIIILAISACAQRSETRSLSSFSEISVGEAIECELILGSKEEAVVKVSGADLEDVITEVSGDRLRIHMARGNFRNTDVKVTVTFKVLEEIKVSSAADLYCNDVIEGDDLEIEVSSAADAELRVQVQDLEVRVSSAADLELDGYAKRQYVDVSSSGDYDAYGLDSEEAEVDVSSSGDARITVKGKLDADASSSGTVLYRGDPEKVYVDSSSGGKVRKS